MTVASWKFKSGAVCSFTHGLVLQGSRYDATLEVYCDGWSFRLVDPYEYEGPFIILPNSSKATLYVRSPKDADDKEAAYTFPDDDPYIKSSSNFLTPDTLANSRPSLTPLKIPQRKTSL